MELISRFQICLNPWSIKVVHQSPSPTTDLPVVVDSGRLKKLSNFLEGYVVGIIDVLKSERLFSSLFDAVVYLEEKKYKEL
ncbi:hypothetical protein ACB092_02G032900 [Castanea dentata]